MFEKSSAGNRSSSRDANYHQYRQALRRLTDAAWALIAPMLPAARRGGRPRTTNIRAVLNASFYLLRTGCQWRLLPREFPVWSTVYHYFRVWKNGGVWTCVQRSMYQQARRQAGRTACPSVVIMDGQSVKTTERGGIRGFDAHKRVKGRKRHILVDTFGLLIACRVEPADISDRRAAALLLGGLGALFPNIRTVIADAGHQSRKLARHLLQQDGWKLQIVKRRQRAFKITGLTWIVERSFAWLGRNRRLSKDYGRVRGVASIQNTNASALIVPNASNRFSRWGRMLVSFVFCIDATPFFLPPLCAVRLTRPITARNRATCGRAGV